MTKKPEAIEDVVTANAEGTELVLNPWRLEAPYFYWGLELVAELWKLHDHWMACGYEQKACAAQMAAKLGERTPEVTK
jgi:hypothetical protein